MLKNPTITNTNNQFIYNPLETDQNQSHNQDIHKVLIYKQLDSFHTMDFVIP